MSDTTLYGRRLMSHLIDERAATNHEQPFATIPRSNDVANGFEDVSYTRLANAVNRAAYWLYDKFGHPERVDIDIVMYIGPPDLRYQILALGAVKSHHVMFFPSPRNLADEMEHLLQDAGCTRLITTNTPPRPLQTMLERRQIYRHVRIPELSFFLDPTPVTKIPLTVTFAQIRYEPWIIIHTSGSTGGSKLVTLRHGSTTVVDAFRRFDQNDTMRLFRTRFIMPFPPFHVAGITFSLAITCFYDSTVILPPAGVPVTANLVHSMHKQTVVDHYILAPSLVSDITKDDQYLAALSRLKGLTFSGGPLPPNVAKLVSERTKLSSGFGATEYGTLPTLPRDPEDWQYFRFNIEQGGMEFREIGTEGLFELVFVRQLSASLVQGIFVNFPDLNEYHTKDLFSKHPTKPGLFKYESRSDDIIVLSNGENLNPLPAEGIITSSPDVKECLIVGHGYPQTAILIRPADETIDDDDLVRRLEPFIERANRQCPTYARLKSQMVIRLLAGEQLLRAPKGTIQRSKNTALFQEEIATLYSTAYNDAYENRAQAGSHQLVTDSSQSLDSLLQHYLQVELGVDKVEPLENLFELGLDSLGVINLTRAINHARQGSGVEMIAMTIVYENPTLSSLTNALQAPQPGSKNTDFDEEVSQEDKTAWTEMEEQYNELVHLLPNTRRRLKRNMFRSNGPAPLYQPDGGFIAWSQVFAAFLINLNNWGLVNSFGVYQDYYQSHLLKASSPSPSAIAWIGTTQGALLLIVGVLSGPLFDRGFFRSILIGTSLALVVAIMLISHATRYAHIMLCQGILTGICLGLLYIPSVALLPLYFKRHRGLALGLATAGGSLGGVIYPIMLQRLIDSVGFPWANRAVGFVSLFSLCLALTIIRPISKRSVRRLVDTTAFIEPSYLTFLAAAFFLFAGALVPFFVIPSFGRSELVNVSDDKVPYLLPMLNAAQFFGRITSGTLADEIGPEMVLLVGEISAAILGFCWLRIRSQDSLFVWILFYGLSSGIIVTLPAVVLPFICPSLSVLGTRLGMLYAVAGLGFLFGAPVALAIDQKLGDFRGVAIWTGVCCLVGCLFYTNTCREARRRRRLYKMRKRR